MAKVTWGADARVTSAEVAKGWILALHNNLIACGLAQASDTGQLDPSTISALPALNGYFGYLVYKFSDTLAGAKPVFIKVRPYYASFGGTAATCGSVAITVGFATDGAGNITGPGSGEFNYLATTSDDPRVDTAAATPSYAIHGEGYLGLCLHIDKTKNNYNNFCMLYLTISRTVDSAGEFTTEGVHLCRNGAAYDSAATNGPASLRPAKALLTTSMAAWRQDLTCWTAGADAASFAGNNQLQRTYRLTPALATDPTMAMHWAPSIVQGDELDLSVDGITRHYLAVGINTGLVADTLNAKNIGFVMLWGDL